MTVLFLHNRYRTAGGEERAVEDLTWLVRERMGEDVELLQRDSSQLGAARAAAGLLGGGLDPAEVSRAVRRTRARVVHAHNLLPALGWRALAAAQRAGARTVLHLHNYRLVCAVATCIDPSGEDCTRCHGRRTLPGVRLGCRGGRPEAVAYAAGLALQQRRLLEHADVLVVPSEAARTRLVALGVDARRAHVVPHVVRRVASEPSPRGTGALVASRLAREKGVEVAIDACERAGVALTVAGDGPRRAELERRAGPGVTFAGRVGAEHLAELRRSAAVELVPSRAHETFGLSAVEAMAAGLPVVASDTGALSELGEAALLVPPGDPDALASAVARAANDEDRARRGLELVKDLCAPDRVAGLLGEVYWPRRAST